MDFNKLEKALDGHYRRFNHCLVCKHSLDTHWANCIECCPVKRNAVTMENYYKRFEACSICEHFEDLEWPCIDDCPVRRGDRSAHLLLNGMESDKEGNLTIG